MRTKLTVLFVLLSLGCWTIAQETTQIPLPKNLEQTHPRLFIKQEDKGALEQTIKQEEWAQSVLSGIHKRIDGYVERHTDDPEWMVSRLQMYWKTKSTDVYIRGMYYSHAEGEAPVPTVRYTGSRDYTTDYGSPKLEDILPYMDDERGLYLPNRTKEGHPFEWVEQASTGGIIHKINEQIMGLARDAAFTYWLEDDERYAKFAYDIFDTYMVGMYYRNAPIDLDNGHIQTLVGLSCFQVIHEKILMQIAELYDYMHPYIEANYADKIALYDATIKRWNDQIIKNGVPQNNWNLHQAKTILKAAMVLQDDVNYDDNKGREYYINYILNVTSARQWSLTKFMDYGYDMNNGVWAECPGYSQGVTKDLTNFIRDFDNTFDHNLLPYMPVMTKAVKMLPQYLFPNGQIVAFGDTYYGSVYTEAMSDMIRIAQKNGDKDLEKEFTAMYRLFEPNAGKAAKASKPRAEVSSFFASKPLELNPNYKAGELSDYLTQTFYAPNVSWHVQRMGTGKDGMMVSLNGSLGNHMHANGINMELYGKGFVQGADPGKGGSYFQPIYLDYYSQFPAHNTVMVDGISKYPEMLSNHGFDLLGEYPQSELKTGFYSDITYSDVYFLEPESRSDQSRLVSVVKTGETTGYYVDIFRSKKQREGDKFHDYFYHNLGQSMQLSDADGKAIELQENEEMGFAGGHLFALDYQWDKKSAMTSDDYQAEWKIDMPEGKDDVFMNLWMKGTEGREVFTLKSPPCKSFKHNGEIPYDVSNDPYLTFAARQHGEAWKHPFVSVYEPYTSAEGKSISSIKGFDDANGNDEFVGLHITHKSGREDYVFSSRKQEKVDYQQMSTDAVYAVVTSEEDGDFVLFVGEGKEIKAHAYSVSSNTAGNIVLEMVDGELHLDNDVPVTVTYKRKKKSYDAGQWRSIKL